MSATDFTSQFNTVPKDALNPIREKAFQAFTQLGVPGPKHEEWKYTRIAGLFNKEYLLTGAGAATKLTDAQLSEVRLPGWEQANELIFVNGVFSAASSTIRSAALTVLPLEQAATSDYASLVAAHLGASGKYLNDGINALNTAFIHGGIFVHVKKGSAVEHPVYIYQLLNEGSVLAQPRSLVYLSENAQIQVTENICTIGGAESFTNGIMEIVVEQDALLELYKIQNDLPGNHQVNTTHIHQTGKSYTHTVTISLNGGIVRNNLNLVLGAEHCEAHLYGLYFGDAQTHIDNHTVVDNVKPHNLSNELYKGIMDGNSTAVFNGKIFVQPQAQKTNAFQSNKNILLSNDATVNTKPQLEIYADDVKCSHGCTVGQLDEEAMFYLQARGVTRNSAKALLVHAFIVDILGHIKPAAIRQYVDEKISERLAI